MSKVRVDSGRLNELAHEMSDLHRALEEQSRQVSGAASVLRQTQAGFVRPACGAISGISDALLTEAAKMQSLSDALRLLAQRYQETESRLSQSGQTSDGGSAGQSDAEDFGSWWSGVLAWIKKLFGWEDPADPETGETPAESEPEGVTKAEEKAHDLYMQEQMFDLLETDRYSKKTWNKATVEQRKEILKSYLQELEKIYGVSVSPDIEYFYGDRNSRGAYVDSRKAVRINENYLSRSDSYQIMQTMIHEMRHAYQHAAVRDPDSYTVSAETIKAWEENLKPGNYKSTSNGYSYTEYVSQPVEWDAKNMAKQYSDVSGADPEYRGSW